MNEYLKRGNMLWESHRMFLPEHRQALLQRKEQLQKVAKPLLDDQELQEIGIVVTESLNYELEIMVEFWAEGFFHSITGVVAQIDIDKKRIKLLHKDDYKFIPIDCLKRVERVL